MRMMKRCLSFFLAILLFASFAIYVSADTDDLPPATDDAPPTDTGGDTDADAAATPELGLSCLSAVLMEASSGTVLYEQEPDLELPPASVTKIMTLLLVMEALEAGTISLSDPVTVSAYAASMGGSQVFLSEGEQMTVEDLVKCTVIASANDAAVALAEHLLGSETAFVARMNERAGELGLSGCRFENVTGLDDDTVEHVLSARDIAVISRELIRHPLILTYSGVWMDTIRDGAFTLTNTNRLIRFYRGATGLKTGSTDKARFCMTATAERDGMSLIAVVMAAPSRDARNDDAKKLLDYGFATYGVYTDPAETSSPVRVCGGTADAVYGTREGYTQVLPKASLSRVEREVSMQGQLTAPVQAGDEIGSVTYRVDGEIIGCVPIRASTDVPRITYWQYVGRMMKIFLLS